MSLNSACFTGRLGGDAELKEIGDKKTPLLGFNMAVDRFKKDSEPIWVSVRLWGNRANGRLQEYLTKGSMVAVTGSIDLSEWTSNDGTARARLELNATDIQFVGGRVGGSSEESEPGSEDEIPFD